jgi:hypothetical protein
MRLCIAIVLFAASVLLPSNSMAQLGPGCGPTNVKFDVKTEKAQNNAPPPEPGKALVFFLQDDFNFKSSPRPTTRFGIDGNWVGATHANSYFFTYVDPGEHHICASWEPMIKLSSPAMRTIAAAHMIAEAGKSYYFRARDVTKTQNPFGSGDIISEAEVVLKPLDSDEAQVLMNTFSFSSSNPKK